MIDIKLYMRYYGHAKSLRHVINVPYLIGISKHKGWGSAKRSNRLMESGTLVCSSIKGGGQVEDLRLSENDITGFSGQGGLYGVYRGM